MTTATATLTEFLLARIAEDELQAKAAVARDLARWSETANTAASRGGSAAGIFILFHNPARVLAECEAKRRIVELAQYVEDVEGGGAEIALQSGYRGYGHGRLDPPLMGVLPALAAVYAEHPDYRTDWRA